MVAFKTSFTMGATVMGGSIPPGSTNHGTVCQNVRFPRRRKKKPSRFADHLKKQSAERIVGISPDEIRSDLPPVGEG